MMKEVTYQQLIMSQIAAGSKPLHSNGCSSCKACSSTGPLINVPHENMTGPAVPKAIRQSEVSSSLV